MLVDDRWSHEHFLSVEVWPPSHLSNCMHIVFNGGFRSGCRIILRGWCCPWLQRERVFLNTCNLVHLNKKTVCWDLYYGALSIKYMWALGSHPDYDAQGWGFMVDTFTSHVHFLKGGVQSTRFLVYMGLTLLEHHILASYHECAFKVYFIILINKINHTSSNIMLWKIDLYQRGKQFKDILYLNLIWDAYMLNCIKHVDFTCKKPWVFKTIEI